MKKTTHYKGHRWTDAELTLLMKMWAEDDPLDEIANRLKSTKTACLKQIQRMRKAGVPLHKRRNGHAATVKYKNWTQGETEYLLRRRNDKATSEEIASELGRSPNAVDAMIQKLRKEEVPVAMRGSGVRRLWDAEWLKVVALCNVPQ